MSLFVGICFLLYFVKLSASTGFYTKHRKEFFIVQPEVLEILPSFLRQRCCKINTSKGSRDVDVDFFLIPYIHFEYHSEMHTIRNSQEDKTSFESVYYVNTSLLVILFRIFSPWAQFKRRTFHVPNQMQISLNKGFCSLTLDSAHEKFDV